MGREIVHIYSEFESNRLKYTLDLLFTQLLGVDYQVSADIHKSYDINYSSKLEISGIQCIPHPIIFESGLFSRNKKELTIEPWDETFGFYRTNGTIPFDLFSASFFLASRYEEHLEYIPDNHKRFSSSQSVLKQYNVLDQPLVNQWALKLMKLLVLAECKASFTPRRFEFISTIDIDQAWKYKNKGLSRNFMGFVTDIVSLKWPKLMERIPVLLNMKSDPFFNFDWQRIKHEENNTNVNYFILFGNRGQYDKNISYLNIPFRALIKDLDKLPFSEVGIHPSYQSNDNPGLLKAEIKRLKEALGREIYISRQHFLIHKYPETVHHLMVNNISIDHTIGYSTDLGFRAGIAAPFYYYDFDLEESSPLLQYPFCIMDITAMHYFEMSPNEAIKLHNTILERIKEVGGLAVSLWHNESLSESERWIGWRKVYEALLQKANILNQ